MKKPLITLCIIISQPYATALESLRLPMTSIQTWEQLKPFACKIVAFIADPGYFTAGNPKPIEYAYISANETEWNGPEGTEVGHEITRLLLPSDISHNTAAVNSELKNVNMFMRLATDEEIIELRTAVANGTLRFNYDCFANNARAALNKETASEIYARMISTY